MRQNFGLDYFIAFYLFHNSALYLEILSARRANAFLPG
jgi:hypothetical protein